MVQFNDEPNLLSNLGIQDQDYIRYEQIQKLKENPSKRELISRLESILENLQR